MSQEKRNMIKVKTTGFTIARPEYLENSEKHIVQDLKSVLNDCIFIIPDHIVENQKKLIYKVGFLKEIYKFLYPEKPHKEIYKLIDKSWQVFKSHRQMERLSAEYIELKEKGEI